jgi:hypothetical protein
MVLKSPSFQTGPRPGEALPLLLLLAVFIIAELVVGPIGDFPLNDDWWYAKTLRIFHEHNFLDSSTWGSSTLLTQLLYAKVFVSLFGVSFTVLRFSTLLLALTGLVYFYLMLKQFILKDRWTAFFLSLLLLFNPLFLSLSNSFMTDVPFLSLVLAGMYYNFKYHESKKYKFFFLSAFLLIAALFCRQLALAFIIGSFLTAFLLTKKISSPYLLLLLGAMLLLFLFEYWLQSQTAGNYYSYVFFSSNRPNSPFVSAIINFFKRWVHHVSFSGLALSPVMLPYLYSYFRGRTFLTQKTNFFIALILYGPLLWSLGNFPIGNYLYNCGIGPETLYDTYIAGIHHGHAESPFIFFLLKILSGAGALGVLIFLVSACSQLVSTYRNKTPFPQPVLCIFVCLFFYYGFLALNSPVFDRYMVIVSSLLLVAFFRLSEIKIRSFLFAGTMLFLMLFSTLGAKDYLAANRTRWTAIDFLVKKNVPHKDINGGYEHAGHRLSDSLNWYEKWNNLPPSKFLISCGTVKNYRIMTWFIYRRYIPLKNDTIFILAKQEEPNLP